MSFQELIVVGPVQVGVLLAAATHPAKSKRTRDSLILHLPIPIVVDIVEWVVTFQLRVQRRPDFSNRSRQILPEPILQCRHFLSELLLSRSPLQLKFS